MWVYYPMCMVMFVTYCEKLVGLNSSTQMLIEGSPEGNILQLFSKTVYTNRLLSCSSCWNLPGELRAAKYLKINRIYIKKWTLKCIDRDKSAFAPKSVGYAYLIYSFSEFENMFVRSVIHLHNLFWCVIGVVTVMGEIKWLAWRLGIQCGKKQLYNVW